MLLGTGCSSCTSWRAVFTSEFCMPLLGVYCCPVTCRHPPGWCHK